MSHNAQAIISSHKEAAKRAVQYLQGARNLKLKPAEALELVARVLGVANWQTLNALAKQSRAPRISEGGSATLGESVDVRARRMAEMYAVANGWKEHPFLLREDWVTCDEDGPDDGYVYWRFVIRRLDEIKAVMPWNREELDDVKVARAGGIDIDYDFAAEELGWGVASAEDDEFLDLAVHDSEAEAWRVAAAAVGVVVGYHLNKDLPWSTMSLTEKLEAVRQAMPWVAQRHGTPLAISPKLVPAPSITRDELVANGFVPTTLADTSGEYLVKVMKAYQMPYTREHIVSTGEVANEDIVRLEVSPNRMLRMTIGESYVEEPVPLDSEDARGVLRDAGMSV